MMLYAAVEGHHPLRRGTTRATLAAVLHDDVPPPVRAGALGQVLTGVLVRGASARPSAAVLDRLAEIESAPAGWTASRDQPTSYPLTPSSGPSPAAFAASGGATTAPGTPVGTGAADPWRAAPPPGFGPSPVLPGQVRITPQPVTAPVPAARRRAAGLRVLWGVPGVSLAAVLTWWLLPLGDDSGDANAGAGPSTSTTSPQSAGVQTASPADQQSRDTETTNRLTPAGVRGVIKAMKEETGRDRFASFSVYEDFATARLRVNGSNAKYDAYTYRPGQGVEKGADSGSLSGSDQPVSLDDFNGDRIPALIKEAH